MQSAFQTPSVRMEPMLLMTVQLPVEDVERIMAAVTGISPLAVGRYDRNAFQSASGTERYRPRQGAAAGEEAEVRLRPGVVELAFELPHEPDVAERVVEAVFQAHSYQEPVIRLQSILSSRAKDHDDSRNPNRWWNTTGDWKRDRTG